MTVRKSVADDVLGRITRKFVDLVRRLTAKRKPLDPERTLHIMQLAADGTPDKQYSNSQVDYVLECGWSWDNSHVEFITICVEGCDREWLCFDRLVDPTLPEKVKKNAMDVLVRMCNGISTGPGSAYMKRLYEITYQRFYGYSPHSGLKGTVTKNMVDMHTVLKPICEFDDKDNPIPCKVEKPAR